MITLQIDGIRKRYQFNLDVDASGTWSAIISDGARTLGTGIASTCDDATLRAREAAVLTLRGAP